MISKLMLDSRKLLLSANAEGMLPVLDFAGYRSGKGTNINPDLLEFIELVAGAAPMHIKMESKNEDDLIYSWNCWQIISPKVSLYIHFTEKHATYRLDYSAGTTKAGNDELLDNLDAITQLEFERRKYTTHVHTYSISMPFESTAMEEDMDKAQNLIDLLVYVLNNFMYRTGSQVKTLDGLKDYIVE